MDESEDADLEELEQLKQMEAEEKAFEEEMKRLEMEQKKELEAEAALDLKLKSNLDDLDSRSEMFSADSEALVGRITSKRDRAKDARSKDISSILDIDSGEIDSVLAEAREKSALEAKKIADAENERLAKLQSEKAAEERQRWARREAELARKRVDAVVAATNARDAEAKFIPRLKKELGSNKGFQQFRKASLQFKNNKMDAKAYLSLFADLIGFRKRGAEILEELLPGLAAVVPTADHRRRLLDAFNAFTEEELAKVGTPTTEETEELDNDEISTTVSSSNVFLTEKGDGSEGTDDSVAATKASESERAKEAKLKADLATKEEERRARERREAEARARRQQEKKKEEERQRREAEDKALAVKKGRELAKKREEAEARARREKEADEARKAQEREEAEAETAASVAADERSNSSASTTSAVGVAYSGGRFNVSIPSWDREGKREIYLIRCSWTGSGTYSKKCTWDTNASYSQLKAMHDQINDRAAQVKRRLGEEVTVPDFPTNNNLLMATGKHIPRLKSVRQVEFRRVYLEKYLEALIRVKSVLSWRPIEDTLKLSKHVKVTKEAALREAQERRRKERAASEESKPSYLRRPEERRNASSATKDTDSGAGEDLSFEDDPLAFLAAQG